IEQRGQQFENLRVSRGRLAAGGGRADHLGSDLIELAVASFLRTLAPELRSYIEEFVESAIPEFVLDVSAYHAGGIFGAEGQRLSFIAFGAAAIFPGKHLLRNNVGLFAHAARKKFGRLENGSADLV